MRGKAISSGERKIILNVSKHFQTKNSSLNENAVLTLTFKVPRISNMELNRQAKYGLTRKNLASWIDEINLGVVRRTIHQFYARGESLADIYFFTPIHAGGTESAPPSLRFSSITPKRHEILKRNFLTLILVIVHILSTTTLIRCCHSNLLFTVCHVIFGFEKASKLEIFSR